MALMVLKLLDKISWSWWWVTAPLWGPIVLVVLGFILFVFYEAHKTKKRRDKAAQNLKERNDIKPERPKSKFQMKLEEAMKAGEEAKKKRNYIS